MFGFFFFFNKVKDKQEQVTHTYNLIETGISMEATKSNKKKIGNMR